MKRFLPLLAVLLAGCFFSALSSNPFYTEETRVPLPELAGEWDGYEMRHPGSSRKEIATTWVFSGNSPLHLRQYDEDGPHDFQVVPFKVAGNLYCDFTGHEHPYHELYRLQFKGRALLLESLDGEWLTNAIAAGTIQLPQPQRDAASNLVFHVTSRQWVDLLAEQGAKTNRFGGDIELTKQARYNFVPLRRQP